MASGGTGPASLAATAEEEEEEEEECEGGRKAGRRGYEGAGWREGKGRGSEGVREGKGEKGRVILERKTRECIFLLFL